MNFYYLLLSFHLISVITWISTIVYIGRLIFLQLGNKNTILQEEAYLIYKKISMPAFIATIFFGIILLFLNKSLLETGFWIYIKFFLISLIIIVHHLCKIYLNQIEKDELKKSNHYLKYLSLSPLFFTAIIIILTINKPF
ncbi:CopD family protein [Arcobacter sp.]|uniref:CopD family protein n=1 Tax=Arcobacter sp. TaxID=1872629 RepID=UPI003C778611